MEPYCCREPSPKAMPYSSPSSPSAAGSPRSKHFLYELSAVVMHHGKGFGSGHYTSYCYNTEGGESFSLLLSLCLGLSREVYTAVKAPVTGGLMLWELFPSSSQNVHIKVQRFLCHSEMPLKGFSWDPCSGWILSCQNETRRHRRRKSQTNASYSCRNDDVPSSALSAVFAGY